MAIFAEWNAARLRIHPQVMKSLLLILLGVTSLHAVECIDLSGSWKFAPDLSDSGLSSAPDQWKFPKTILLPGQVAAQGFGDKPSILTKWTGHGWKHPDLFKEWQADDNFKFPFFLQPPLHYLGPAWYQKQIEIPAGWQGLHALLHLERVHWQSTVWVDGKQIGKCNSLGTPHEYDLGALPPGTHTLTMRIDNRILDVNPGPLSHSITDHTQGNWNGVVGRIELRPVASLRLLEARIEASLAGKSVKVNVTTNEPQKGKVTAKVRYLGPLRDLFESKTVNADLIDGRAEIIIPMDREPRAWNEFTPHLYQADIVLESSSGKDLRSETFGFRDLSRKEGRLAINGVPIFLRGTLECAIFPLTGYPPTDLDAWRRIVKICKAHGLNHIRFHSWCPPEAAFIAADEAGFYYQVEASSWANQGAVIGSGKPLDAWIDEETTRMIRELGNHPSFLMMAYGNEPNGPNHKKWLQEWVARWKAKDPRRFWTTAAGWPLMAGSDYHNMMEPRIQAWGKGLRSILNTEAPRTDFDWSDFVNAHSDAPVVSHEIGQWCVYPNFDEIPKYTGFFKARNFEIFQETAKRNGLLPQAKDFLMASGKLQTLCYKHDIEAAMRTRSFGGFQLLDLHDFPGQGTALVGVLDAFWDSKGYVTADEYARFAGPVVPLAKLQKMTWQANETLEAELQLCHFGPSDFKGMEPTWKLTNGETIVAEGVLPARDVAAGGLRELGTIRIPLPIQNAPAHLKLTVGARSEKFSNDWSIFVYPDEASAAVPPNVTLTRSLNEALAALNNGKSVLWMPPSADVKDDSARPLSAGFSSIFWNTAWTDWQPPHTLGILCDPNHPALAGFPTDFHSDWQWWELQKDARPFLLTRHHGIRPVVQIIDDWVTNRKLGYVFEAKVGPGKLVACSFDLESDLENRKVALQMRTSLLAYLSTDRFAPTYTMDKADLEVLVKTIQP
jgi:Glycosyl hydrolases family 2, sugar binding domain/Glycosyl hydrolases family 2